MVRVRVRVYLTLTAIFGQGVAIKFRNSPDAGRIRLGGGLRSSNAPVSTVLFTLSLSSIQCVVFYAKNINCRHFFKIRLYIIHE